MSPQDLPSDECAPSAASPDRVTLSKWVNERFPPWEQLLSAHDVARLTRRPRRVLLGLTLLGRFPRKHCFHGRRIGWLRDDVLDWIGKGASCDEGRAPLGVPRAGSRSVRTLAVCCEAASAASDYLTGGCMSLRKRGSVWWIDIATPSGERVRRSAETGDKAQAQELHDKLKSEVWRLQ